MRFVARAIVWRLRRMRPWMAERRALRRLYGHPGVSRRARFYGAERIRLGRNVRIHPYATIDCRLDPFLGDDSLGRSEVVIGDDTVIASHAMLMAYGGRIALGRNCSVNPFTVLYGSGGLTVGDSTRIATHTVIVPSNHVFEDPTTPICRQGVEQKGIVIGEDVWIGANVTVLDGVEIGDGCVVAAQAVVTKSFPPFHVIAGVPGRTVKVRGDRSVEGAAPRMVERVAPGR